jgi:transcriptional/translational regulatory protein YebC/TACO1
MAIVATGALMSAGATAIATGTMAGFAMNFAVAFALGAAMKALTPKPSISSGASRGYQTNSLGPAQDHQIIYGRMRVGGAIVFDEATGDNNKFLHRLLMRYTLTTNYLLQLQTVI